MRHLKESALPAATMGIDPGIGVTGYAIVRGKDLVEAGAIRTRTKDPEPVRYAVLMTQISRLLEKHAVAHVAIEEFETFYQNKPGDPPGGTQAPLAVRNGGKGNLLAVALGQSSGGKRRYAHDRTEVNPRSMFLLKGAQTIAQVAALQHGASIFLYKVREWKGNAKKGKSEIREEVKRLYKVEIRNHNVADAVMIATHHADRSIYGSLIQPTSTPAQVASALAALTEV
jgi:Holliday junction resolvasome RuvABC endonuclease subunit